MDNEHLAGMVPDGYQALANSPSMRRIDEALTRIALTDVTVLLSGESGVGKEVLARTIHERSHRRAKPFVKVNCAALPVELIESELFGFERGAFTGASHQRRGLFEQAQDGTVFLDEISEMPLSGQATLLHVLQDRQFTRLGSEHDIQIDARVVAATNRDLSRHMAQGRFREDLYHRLNVIHIRVPPLRERPEEIPILVDHFLGLYRRKHGGGPFALSPEARERLWRYSWPGNVRELENVIQRVVLLGTESVIAELDASEPEAPIGEMAMVPPSELASHALPFPSSVGLRELGRRAAETAERDVLQRTLADVRWRRIEAAHRLGISYRTLLEKIKRYRLDSTD